MIADKKRVAELMNKYFINITNNLNLKAPIINTIDDIQSLTKNYENHINVTILKQTIDVHLQHLTNTINHRIQTKCFPDKLKQSKDIAVYKKLDPFLKGPWENHIQTDKYIHGR